VWCLNTRLGYLIQFDPYQGASSTYDANLGFAGSVVMDLLSEMPAGVDISVYFDNFFTILKLLDGLTSEGIHASGTERSNRLADCSLPPADQLKKKPRGTYDYRKDVASGIIVVHWNDNNIVSGGHLPRRAR